MRDIPWHTVALALLVVAVVATAGLGAVRSSDNFGAYNHGWDGTAELRGLAEDDAARSATVARNTSAYGNVPANATVAVVLSPDKPYTEAQLRQIRGFVASGGTLVVAGDFGDHTNDLLAGVGATTRLDGRVLRDPRRYDRGPAMPRITNVTRSPLTRGVDTLVFNYGTALASRPANGTVLATSARSAYLDTNANGTLDASESVGRYPVAASERLDSGRVVVVADSSLFVNAMLERGDNRRFAARVLAGHERVLLDYSHTASVPPLVGLLFTLREQAVLQLVVTLAALLCIAAWTRRDRLRDWVGGEAEGATIPRPDADAIDDYLAREHPEWDADRRERVVKGVITRRRESSRND
ncbi:DUF4350 domain-containing protein [Halarchaeum sp. P4]|uniref:DUF4350 domain-containing protein n=1 Tax=Halarchaeum sp. P4 TaxID=3421639 RepID=UPI003EB7291E